MTQVKKQWGPLSREGQAYVLSKRLEWWTRGENNLLLKGLINRESILWFFSLLHFSETAGTLAGCSGGSSGWPFDQGPACLRASCLQSVWTQPKTSLNPQTHTVLPGQ